MLLHATALFQPYPLPGQSALTYLKIVGCSKPGWAVAALAGGRHAVDGSQQGDAKGVVCAMVSGQRQGVKLKRGERLPVLLSPWVILCRPPGWRSHNERQ